MEFPHSDTHGSTLVWQLTVIFRGLHRPSSPACPKASTLCPESLIAFLIGKISFETLLFAYSVNSETNLKASRLSLDCLVMVHLFGHNSTTVFSAPQSLRFAVAIEMTFEVPS
jgi:hypothetical protein